jgi:spore coat protein U-like protein
MVSAFYVLNCQLLACQEKIASVGLDNSNAIDLSNVEELQFTQQEDSLSAVTAAADVEVRCYS